MKPSSTKTLLLSVIAAAALAVPSKAQEKPLIEKHAATLAALGAKDAKGGWVVSDAALGEVKKDLGAVLKEDPTNIAIHTDKESGSGLIGGCVSGVLKPTKSFFVVDSLGEKLVAPVAVLAGKFNDEVGREQFLSVIYDEGYKVAIGVKVCAGSVNMMRDGGSIAASVVCPGGEKIAIRRIKSDPATLTVNLLPFKNIL